MATPHVSGSFGDLLDPRFQKIYQEWLSELPEKRTMLYSVAPTNGRSDMRWSQVGTMPEWSAFSGSVGYQSLNQGYDTTSTPVEFASGFQVERKLFDDDQYQIMDQKPRALATSANRTRETHAARMLVNGFSVDNYFYNNSEGVALCSNSHTTTSGASTSTGFDNLGTAAMSATAVAAARIAMVKFRGDQAERVSVRPDELWFPPDLYETAFEIVKSQGKLDTPNNNPNVHEGAYQLREWNYLDADANNWFVADSVLRKQMVFWVDRVPPEFAFAEDLDTIIAKWRGYMRYSTAHVDWRWLFGHQVS